MWAVKTGEKPFEKTHGGLSAWEWLKKDPREEDKFSKAMQEVDSMGKFLLSYSMVDSKGVSEPLQGRYLFLWPPALSVSALVRSAGLARCLQIASHRKVIASWMEQISHATTESKQGKHGWQVVPGKNSKDASAVAGTIAMAIDYEWNSHGRVLDIGGAYGSFLVHVLSANTKPRAVLFDQHQVSILYACLQDLAFGRISLSTPQVQVHLHGFCPSDC